MNLEGNKFDGRFDGEPSSPSEDGELNPRCDGECVSPEGFRLLPSKYLFRPAMDADDLNNIQVTAVRTASFDADLYCYDLTRDSVNGKRGYGGGDLEFQAEFKKFKDAVYDVLCRTYREIGDSVFISCAPGECLATKTAILELHEEGRVELTGAVKQCFGWREDFPPDDPEHEHKCSYLELLEGWITPR